MLHQLPNVLVCVPVKGGGRLVKDQEFASSDKHIMMVMTKIIDMLTKMMTKATMRLTLGSPLPSKQVVAGQNSNCFRPLSNRHPGA